MEFKAHYTIVGAFVVVFTTAAIALGLWLSVGFQLKPYEIYEVFMNEAVSGLSEQAPVKFNGVQVGRVRSIRLNILNPQQVRLLLDIEEGTPITVSTVATLRSQGITGIAYIGLSAERAHAEPLHTLSGQRYPVIAAAPSLLFQLDTTFRDLTKNINGVAVAIRKALSPENRVVFTQILANTNQFLQILAQNKNNLQVILTQFAKASQTLPLLVKTSQNTVQSLKHASDATADAMQAGGQAFDQVSAQTLPEASHLIEQLEALATHLEALSETLEEDPSLVIRGSKAPKLGPGE